jgi:hypothetical protein
VSDSLSLASGTFFALEFILGIDSQKFAKKVVVMKWNLCYKQLAPLKTGELPKNKRCNRRESSVRQPRESERERTRE